jgi:tagatose-1,6-bisphosphate aldolase
VANNSSKALSLQQQADDLEDMLSKENSDVSTAVTMFAKVRAVMSSKLTSVASSMFLT